jgi:hypothetical protein
MIIANRSPEVLRSLDQAATDLAAPLKHRVSLETKLRQNLLHLLEGWPVDFQEDHQPIFRDARLAVNPEDFGFNTLDHMDLTHIGFAFSTQFPKTATSVFLDRDGQKHRHLYTLPRASQEPLATWEKQHKGRLVSIDIFNKQSGVLNFIPYAHVPLLRDYQEALRQRQVVESQKHEIDEGRTFHMTAPYQNNVRVPLGPHAIDFKTDVELFTDLRHLYLTAFAESPSAFFVHARHALEKSRRAGRVTPRWWSRLNVFLHLIQGLPFPRQSWYDPIVKTALPLCRDLLPPAPVKEASSSFPHIAGVSPLKTKLRVRLTNGQSRTYEFKGRPPLAAADSDALLFFQIHAGRDIHWPLLHHHILFDELVPLSPHSGK